MRRSIFALLVLSIVCLAAACGTVEKEKTGNAAISTAPGVPENSAQPEGTEPGQTAAQTTDKQKPSPEQKPDEQESPLPGTFEERLVRTIQATITMEDGDKIVVELYPDLAPQSVRNFVHLAREGFYDGLKFHRIIKGFMIQGGCPLGTGTGGPGYTIKGEFAANGFENDLSHTRGVLSMARANAPDSAGSQFFIMHADSDFLDGKYAAFGKVISGMDVVDRLAETPVLDDNGTVAKQDMPVIKSITIDDDIELPEPIKLN